MDGDRAVMRPTTTIALAGDAATVAAGGRAAIATLAEGSLGVDAMAPKVVLSLPSRDVLRKTIVLPSAVEPNLRQTLAYDLDRHTPFKAEELHFDAVVVGRSPEKKEIRVDLVSCRKAVVDAALRHAAAWGATVLAVVPELPAAASASRLNLLPHESRASHVVWKRWQFWLPLGLVAAVALAAIAIPLWQKRDFAIALNTLANGARNQAAVSDALRAELETKAGDYNFALEKKYAYPSAFRVIDEVSRVLPDDTWLTQMEMKTVARGKENQRELLVRGESANAGRLVQLVEESTLFAQTAPRSPTTKIQPGPGEIFDLGAQVKPLPAPAQVALLGADKSADAVGNVAVPAPTAAPTATAPASAPAPTASSATAPEAGPAPSATEKGPDAAAPSSPTAPPAGAPAGGSTNAPATAPSAPAATPAKPAVTVPVAVAPPTTAAKAMGPPPAGVPDPWLSTAKPKPVTAPPAAAAPPSPSMVQPKSPVMPAPAPSANAGNGAKP